MSRLRRGAIDISLVNSMTLLFSIDQVLCPFLHNIGFMLRNNIRVSLTCASNKTDILESRARAEAGTTRVSTPARSRRDVSQVRHSNAIYDE